MFTPGRRLAAEVALEHPFFAPIRMKKAEVRILVSGFYDKEIRHRFRRCARALMETNSF